MKSDIQEALLNIKNGTNMDGEEENKFEREEQWIEELILRKTEEAALMKDEPIV